MSDTKWTPGPWQVGYDSKIAPDAKEYNRHPIVGCIDRHAPDPRFPRMQIADIITRRESSDGPIETDANANLIAAAPELYEALEAMRYARGSWLEISSKADAALAKARGEPAVQSRPDQQEPDPGAQGGQNK